MSTHCIAGPACRAAHDVDGERRAATVDDHPLCDACHTNLTDCARQLLTDYQHLADSIGEHTTTTGEYVKSSPTPAIPINTGTESIMAAILEIADRAAATISNQLGTTQPRARRKLQHNIVSQHIAETFDIPLGPYEARSGSIALHTHRHVRPTDHQTLTTAVRLIEPNIDTLVAAPAAPHPVWSTPHRCDHHTALIESAEAWLTIVTPRDREAARHEIAAALRAAAHCDDCNGWSDNGQARGVTHYTGLDIAHQIRNIHHRTREHLGHTRLRHHYTMPCPAVDKHGNYCGAMKLGRDDGSDWVNCQHCDTRWTEREYNWLKTQIAGDKEIDMLRWLLAEAYWRLDTLQRGAEAIRDDPRMNEPGSGHFVLQGIDIILTAGDGHPHPENRQTTPTDDRKKKGGKRK